MAWVVLVREKPNGEWREWFATRHTHQPRLKLEQAMAVMIEGFIRRNFGALEVRVLSTHYVAQFRARAIAKMAKAAGAGR